MSATLGEHQLGIFRGPWALFCVLTAEAIRSSVHLTIQRHGGGDEHIYWAIFISLECELHRASTVLVLFTAISPAPTSVPFT